MTRDELEIPADYVTQHRLFYCICYNNNNIKNQHKCNNNHDNTNIYFSTKHTSLVLCIFSGTPASFIKQNLSVMIH